MKILFLYNDKTHAWPLLRSAEAAFSLGIEIESVYETSAQDVVDHLAGAFDVLLIHQELMSDDVVACDRPVIILERIDGAQLGAGRKWLPEVAGLFKGYTFRNPRLHNQYRGRVHVHQLHEAGVLARKSAVITGEPSPQLSDVDLAKIHAFYGFGAYQKQEQNWQRQIDFRTDRQVPVHFAGTVAYSGSEIEEIRRSAVAMAIQLDGIGGEGRVLRKGQYTHTMMQSRTVLCPPGWGESAHRDYEALLLGCVMIKPTCSHLDAWPNIYVPTVTYLPCKPDWSDVPALVERVSTDWRGFRRWRERARRLALECGSEAKIAARLQELLEKVL